MTQQCEGTLCCRHAAGVLGGLGPLEGMGVAEFEKTLQINLTGVMLGE